MAKKDENKNLPATREAMGVAQGDMPDFLKQGTGLGNEGVSSNDISIPRLAIVQSQSPELDADDPTKYIEGAKQGQMFNTLTRELYDSIRLVDVFYRKEYAVFVKRTAGGGFRGSYPTQHEAVIAVQESDKPQDLEIIETGLHFCIIVDEALNYLGEIVVPMTSTKLKVSRTWNSMIRMRGGDRFSGTWVMTTKKEKNDKGNFFNFAVAGGPWVNEALYAKAKEAYNLISTGQKDVDRREMGGESAEVESDKF